MSFSKRAEECKGVVRFVSDEPVRVIFPQDQTFERKNPTFKNTTNVFAVAYDTDAGEAVIMKMTEGTANKVARQWAADREFEIERVENDKGKVRYKVTVIEKKVSDDVMKEVEKAIKEAGLDDDKAVNEAIDGFEVPF